MSENVNEVDKNRVRTFIGNVRQEIQNMKGGQGKFNNVAIHFDKGDQAPVIQRLARLEENPTPENLDIFLMLANQDLGSDTGAAFRNWSLGMFPEVEKKAAKKEAPYETRLYNAVYEIFKSVNVGLTVQQSERLERGVAKLSELLVKQAEQELEAGLSKINKNVAELADLVAGSAALTVKAERGIIELRERAGLITEAPPTWEDS